MKLFKPTNLSNGLQSILLLCVLWAALIGGLFAWEYNAATDHATHMIKMDAKAAFNKDQSIRQWASSHGGVYI
ncbi:MAG: hypothetical protein OEX17_08865, partial [Rhodospirillaceae bacterium]|nr:hypothetical protein [Rhodospirillaceae bacterium]